MAVKNKLIENISLLQVRILLQCMGYLITVETTKSTPNGEGRSMVVD